MVVAGLILNTGRKKIERRTRKWYTNPNIHMLHMLYKKCQIGAVFESLACKIAEN